MCVCSNTRWRFSPLTSIQQWLSPVHFSSCTAEPSRCPRHLTLPSIHLTNTPLSFSKPPLSGENELSEHYSSQSHTATHSCRPVFPQSKPKLLHEERGTCSRVKLNIMGVCLHWKCSTDHRSSVDYPRLVSGLKFACKWHWWATYTWNWLLVNMVWFIVKSRMSTFRTFL